MDSPRDIILRGQIHFFERLCTVFPFPLVAMTACVQWPQSEVTSVSSDSVLPWGCSECHHLRAAPFLPGH